MRTPWNIKVTQQVYNTEKAWKQIWSNPSEVIYNTNCLVKAGQCDIENNSKYNYKYTKLRDTNKKFSDLICKK